MAEVANLAKGLKGMDMSGVEAADDQDEPTIAAGSAEEKAALEEMVALLPDNLKGLPTSTHLMFLRPRRNQDSSASSGTTLKGAKCIIIIEEFAFPP